MEKQVHIFPADDFEKMCKPGNIRAVLMFVLKEKAFKPNIEIPNYKKNYKLELYESKKKHRPNALLESVVLLNLLNSNEEYLKENLKDEYKEASDLKKWKLFKKAEDFYNLFKKNWENKKEIFNEDLKTLEAKINETIEKVKNNESEEIVSDGSFSDDNFNSSSSTGSAPQTPKKGNESNVQVEISVNKLKEQNENEGKSIESKLENFEEKKAEEVRKKAENQENEEAADKLDEEEKEKLEEEMAAKLEEEEKEKLEEETEADKLGEEEKEELEEETEAKSEEEGESKSQDEHEIDKVKKEEKLQNVNEVKSWSKNFLGAFFSAIGLGGSIAAAIFLIDGTLAALPVVGLILAGAVTATVALVSLGTLIYNLVKFYKNKLQDEMNKLQNEMKKENNDKGKGTKSQEILNENSIQNEVNQNQETNQQQTTENSSIFPSNPENVDENQVPAQESDPNKGKGD